MQAVAYARYSSDNQRQESIKAQLRAIYAYAEKNNIDVTKVYADEAKTATSDEREDFQQMINELDIIQPDLILVHKFDRFARDRVDAGYYRWIIKKKKIRLVAVDQDFGDTPEAVMMESVIEGMADYFSKNLSREVKKGQTETVMDLKHCGGIPPLGYDLDQNNHYIINEHEAEAIRLIFKRKLESKSYGDISDELNRLGFATKKGRAFGKNSLYDILRNEKYIGRYVFRKTSPSNSRAAEDPSKTLRINNALPAIIDDITFYKVQEILDGKKHQPRKSHVDYWLTGLLKCGSCNQAMVGNSIPKKTKNGTVYYGYYSCNLAKRTKECLNSKRYSKLQIENKVMDKIEAQGAAIKDINKSAKELLSKIKELSKDQDMERNNLEKQLSKLNKEIDNMTQAIADGVDARILAPKINKANYDKEKLERQLKLTPSFLDGITLESVKSYLRYAKNIKFDRSDPESCKITISNAVKEITILDDEVRVVLKGQSIAN